MLKKSKTNYKSIVVSVVTPAFNESKNLPILYTRIKKALEKLGLSWEWIVIDDRSADDTYAVIEKIAGQDKRVRAFQFAKNSGSHLALACGLRAARGQCAVGMAADLQDPPETIGELLKKWKNGAPIVWAVRSEREGESFSTLFFSRLYYLIMRYGVGLRQIPPSGADFFLLDKAVLKTLSKAPIKNASLLLLICSLNYRQDFITYIKKERVHGKSGWNLQKKLKLFFDSITMFSKAPVWWLIAAGLVFIAVPIILLLGKCSVGEKLFYWVVISYVFGISMLGAGFFLLFILKNASLDPPYVIEKKTRSQ